MKIIGGNERLKELEQEEKHVCPGCNGTGHGRTLVDPWGHPWESPCDDCGGWGDDQAWERYLDEILYYDDTF